MILNILSKLRKFIYTKTTGTVKYEQIFNNTSNMKVLEFILPYGLRSELVIGRSPIQTPILQD